MNREMKRVSIVVLMMFIALLVSTSVIQVFQADSLNADPRNSRSRLDSYSVQRGSILAGGQPIAQSVPSADVYKYQRVYSNGPMYSAVTGFFPIDGVPTGLEGALNTNLSGSSNTQFFDRVNSILTGKNPQGESVETTIVPAIQTAAWDALGNYQGAVVVIQPKTGKILAMVSKPAYDPNQLAVHDTAKALTTYNDLLQAPGDPLINTAIAGNLNPPGSTFKLIVASAAFESGKFTENSELPNPAALTLPGTSTTVLNDTHTACGPGDTVTIKTALALSCNIPFAELGMQIGSDAIKKQAEKYGFNQKLQIPTAVTPSVYPGYPYAAQVGMSAFGQADDRATPLQMAMVTSGIANGGKVMYPDLVDSILSPNLQPVETFTPKAFGTAVSRQTANTISQMMVNDVDNGIITNARIDGVSVGGKTGTAQNGPTQPYSLWFTGFAPADDPQYAIAVVVENGGGQGQSGSGNSIATPIARQVLEAVLNK